MRQRRKLCYLRWVSFAGSAGVLFTSQTQRQLTLTKYFGFDTGTAVPFVRRQRG
jgi:hypothetical protein